MKRAPKVRFTVNDQYFYGLPESLRVGDVVAIPWYASGPGEAAFFRALAARGLDFGESPIHSAPRKRLDYYRIREKRD